MIIKNKKCVASLITGGFLIGAILIGIFIILILNVGSGAIFFGAISKIPVLVWIGLGIVLLFKLIGNKK